MEFVLESNDISNYLKSDKYIDFYDETIQQKADELFVPYSNEREKIKVAYHFVRDEIHQTGSESLFAILYAISNIPLLIAPLGGAIADRCNRRNLMVIFDFTSSAVVLCLILLMGTGKASTLMIGVIMVPLSIVSALYTPAVTASISLLVANDKLEGANGIVQAVQTLSGGAAPVLGGVLYGIMGVQIIIILSCVSFFLFIITKIQKVTPNENLGKVMAIVMAVAQCAAPLEQILYGVIFEKFNAQVFISTFSVSAMTLILSVLTHRLLKNKEDTVQ